MVPKGGIEPPRVSPPFRHLHSSPERAGCLDGVYGTRLFGCQPKTIARIDSDERSNPVIGKRTVSPTPEAPAT